MAEALAETPGSSSTGKAPAVKDRECQYCHQAFTSSSLGRHLDLYIKGKNAKPPDDIHDVEEIRRLRGNVTRRQARTSSRKREGSTPSSAKATPLRDQRSPSVQRGYHSNHPRYQDGGPIRTYLNKPNWQSTGVINNLPSTLDNPIYSGRQSPSRRTSVKEEIIHKQNMLEERDRARAAELALREVLDSVQAANSRAHPSSPFDFNFFAMSFPELCLQCLSAPQSLLSSPAIPNPNSWSPEAPKAAHYEGLRDWLETKLADWRRRGQLQYTQPNNHHHNGTNGHSDLQLGSEDSEEVVGRYRQHLSSAYDSWIVLSDKKKQDMWLLECAKAFTREEERHKETRRKLDLAEQEIQHLRSLVAQQTRQHPELLAFGPNTLPISRETAEYLPTTPGSWNYEILLAKWKGRIQSSRKTQHQLPAPWATATPSRLNNDHINGSAYLAEKQSHENNDERPPSDEDEDLADAPGDEDDMAMEKGVLDPSLRANEVDGEGQAGGRMLLGLREYAEPGERERRMAMGRG